MLISMEEQNTSNNNQNELKGDATPKTNKLLYIFLVLLLAIALLGFLWLVAEGDEDPGDAENLPAGNNGEFIELPPEQDDMTDIEEPEYERDPSYEGLTEEEAITQAEEADTPYRVIARDGEQFPATMDYNPERINFTVEDGVVTRAEFY
jgi:hypothetical protein